MRAERRDSTKRRLIEATIACMCEVGYFDTTTPMIARRAKVSRGALQHHFRSRNDLFLAVTERVGAELASAFDSGIEAGMPVETRVKHICETYWRVYRSDAFIAQVQIWTGARNDKPLQARMQAMTRRMLQSQNRLWHRAFAELGVPPERLAALRGLTLSAIRGLALRPAYRLDASERPREIAVLSEMVAAALACEKAAPHATAMRPRRSRKEPRAAPTPKRAARPANRGEARA